ncbi:MAG: hypothetical protein HWE13_15745 [Gammaproteobacteria bacterium]|nr:hypothetical protein [Gammaproteobacteria bacterium]
MKTLMKTGVSALAALILMPTVNAIGPVSSPGWYYTTISYASGSASFGRMGPFSTEAECQATRWNDYGDGGAIPWDGGPGCFYLYESGIGAYNELLQHWNLVTGPNTGNPTIATEMKPALLEVNMLIEQHDIRDYRDALSRISNIRSTSAEQPQR